MGREIWFGTIFAVYRKLKKYSADAYTCLRIAAFSSSVWVVLRFAWFSANVLAARRARKKSSAGSSVELEVRTLNRKGGTWTRWLMLVFITVVAVRCKVLSCSGVVA